METSCSASPLRHPSSCIGACRELDLSLSNGDLLVPQDQSIGCARVFVADELHPLGCHVIHLVGMNLVFIR